MSVESLKVGIVGCGDVSQAAHLPAWSRQKNVKIAAICDTNIELARKVANRFKITHAYSNLSEMLLNEKLNIVDICTSIQTHYPLLVEAMEAGCHVFVEKSMTATTKEADDVLELQNGKNVKLCVNHNMLFLPTVLKIKSILDKGLLGDILSVEIRQTCVIKDFPILVIPNSWIHHLRGGIFAELLPHPIYLAREFLGEMELQGVSARKVGSYEYIPVDDVHIMMKGTKAHGVIDISLNGPTLWHMNIYGTKMNIRADLNNSYMVMYRGKYTAGTGKPIICAWENLSESYQILANTLSIGLKYLSNKQHSLDVILSLYIDSILNDKETPITAEQGRQNVRFLQSVCERL